MKFICYQCAASFDQFKGFMEHYFSEHKSQKDDTKSPCLKCKRYQKCTRNCEWFSYPEIRFCPYQVMWILSEAEKLQAGNWPLNPDVSSYIDPGIKVGYRSEAYFVKAAIIVAEVERRLDRTGISGKLLKEQVLRGVDYKELEPESMSALMYVKGNKEKRLRFSAWKKQVKYRHR